MYVSSSHVAPRVPLTPSLTASCQKRFTVVPEHVPPFLEAEQQVVLACGKYLHVFRECAQPKENPLAQQVTCVAHPLLPARPF